MRVIRGGFKLPNWEIGWLLHRGSFVMTVLEEKPELSPVDVDIECRANGDHGNASDICRF